MRGDFGDAIADCNEAVRINPRSAEAFYARGWAWEKSGDFDKAVADYSEALRLNPKSAEALCAPRTRLCTQWPILTRRLPTCGSNTDRAKSAKVYCIRGFAYKEQGYIRKAIADCTKAVRLNPEYAEAYYCEELSTTT